MAHTIRKKYFVRAASDIGRSGDNDTLPYDSDALFVKERAENLAEICKATYDRINSIKDGKEAAAYVASLEVFSERLLAPAGADGFRITTKIHPFWNVYLNGLAISVAERMESRRSPRVLSYRLSTDTDRIFDPKWSWRKYRESTINSPSVDNDGAIVVQTDISSFYERIYHHRLENILQEIVGQDCNLPLQFDRFLSKFAAGRSFGLPVGGQFSRILAEAMLLSIDTTLDDENIDWYRYVDDFTLICESRQSAYRALSRLSHVLADYGLSLNRTKTSLLSGRHFKELVRAQVGADAEPSSALHELDLHFDPYSDTAVSQYETLRSAVTSIDFDFLLKLEQQKSQPDNFIITQISRALRFQSPETAIGLCATLLDSRNLDAFRASWSKIMRGIYAVRADDQFSAIYEAIDRKLDDLPQTVSHLLTSEANILHYLKVLRLKKTEHRGKFVRTVFRSTRSETVKRACVECWQHWRDGPGFNLLRNEWASLSPEVQRMTWLAAGAFGENGSHARGQLRAGIERTWALGTEDGISLSFAREFAEWAGDGG